MPYSFQVVKYLCLEGRPLRSYTLYFGAPTTVELTKAKNSEPLPFSTQSGAMRSTLHWEVSVTSSQIRQLGSVTHFSLRVPHEVNEIGHFPCLQNGKMETQSSGAQLCWESQGQIPALHPYVLSSKLRQLWQVWRGHRAETQGSAHGQLWYGNPRVGLGSR